MDFNNGLKLPQTNHNILPTNDHDSIPNLKKSKSRFKKATFRDVSPLGLLKD